MTCEEAIARNPAPPHPLATHYPLRVSWRSTLPTGFHAETAAEQIERRLGHPNVLPWERQTLRGLLARLERAE